VNVLLRGGEIPGAAHVFPCEAIVRRLLRGGDGGVLLGGYYEACDGGVGAPFFL